MLVLLLGAALRTYVADVVVGYLAEEELGAVGNGLPRAQRADVLLSVFHLRSRNGASCESFAFRWKTGHFRAVHFDC